MKTKRVPTIPDNIYLSLTDCLTTVQHVSTKLTNVICNECDFLGHHEPELVSLGPYLFLLQAAGFRDKPRC